MLITARFNIFGYETTDINLIPALGVGLIALVFFLMIQTM